MSTSKATISAQEFVLKTINKSFLVQSTKVDKTLKAIINYFKQNSEIVCYLNRLRIVYYMSRLSYFNRKKHADTLSKFSFFFII